MKTRRKTLGILMAVVLLLLLLSLSSGYAAIPYTINYQGYLTDSQGTPVNGTVTMVFSLYEVATGGTAFWSEPQNNVLVSNGIYNVILGKVNTLNAPSLIFDRPYYLGVKVGNDPEMTPRQQLTSVAYALFADTALDLLCNGCVSDTYIGFNYAGSSSKGGPATDLVCTNCVSQSELSFTPGDITGVTAGAGLAGGGLSGNVSLSVNFAGTGIATTASRSDHNHDATYVNEGQANSLTSAMIQDGTILFADMNQNGCGNGQVMKWNGTAWACATDNAGSGDNLGNHTATQNIKLGSYWLSGDGGNEGISVDTAGTITMKGDIKTDRWSTASDTNTLIGVGVAGEDNLSHVSGDDGWYNTAVGWQTLFANTTGNQNVAVGSLALKANKTGFYNSAVGYAALISNTTGSSNSAVGRGALVSNTTGFNNSALGYEALALNTAGNNNLAVGKSAGFHAAGSGNVFLGYYAGFNETGSNKLYIANAEDNTLIYGQFDNKRVCINCTNPSDTLDVNGNVKVGGNLGIGTASPSAPLNIQQVNGTDILFSGGMYNSDIISTTEFLIGTQGQDKFHFITNNFYRMTVDGTGNVGIGTTTPSQKLDVNGNVNVTGNVSITGNLSKGSGSFKIDHPLDPENKYLYHSFVESPDMKNIYDGVAILDNHGEALVELPEWFEALNKDFRYQLTCIGSFAPVYIAEKISDNRFKIAGGKAGMEVSWQVTGIRQDPYANAHRIVVEEEKPDNEKGTYLHPDVYVGY